LQRMARLLTADDIIPLVASLPDSERIRLLRWIASPRGPDAVPYKVAPPTHDEFSADDERLRGKPTAGKTFIDSGEIRWYTFRLPDKRRPVLVLTRDEVIDRLNEIIVAPVTRIIRGLRTQVLLTEQDGMPFACGFDLE